MDVRRSAGDEADALSVICAGDEPSPSPTADPDPDRVPPPPKPKPTYEAEADGESGAGEPSCARDDEATSAAIGGAPAARILATLCERRIVLTAADDGGGEVGAI